VRLAGSAPRDTTLRSGGQKQKAENALISPRTRAGHFLQIGQQSPILLERRVG